MKAQQIVGRVLVVTLAVVAGCALAARYWMSPTRSFEMLRAKAVLEADIRPWIDRPSVYQSARTFFQLGSEGATGVDRSADEPDWPAAFLEALPHIVRGAYPDAAQRAPNGDLRWAAYRRGMQAYVILVRPNKDFFPVTLVLEQRFDVRPWKPQWALIGVARRFPSCPPRWHPIPLSDC